MDPLLPTTLAMLLYASAAAPADGPGQTGLGPLQSAECRQALEVLQAQEAAAASAARSAHLTSEGRGRGVPDKNLQSAQRSAAAACLAGGADGVALPERSAQPPVAPAPPSMLRPVVPAAVALPQFAVPRLAPSVPPRPAAILSCDAVGCWANDGARLNRLGPNLWGPQGPCTLVGALLQCP